MIIEFALVALIFLLAFSNGANDISKGIATLVGSETASLRKATLWGVLTTAMGSVAAIMFGGVLLDVFSTGLLADGTDPANIAFAVALGTTGWLLFASWSGHPVSTTHALVGAIVGAGVAQHGAEGVSWIGLLTKAFIPLLVSPLISFGVAYFVFPFVSRRFASSKEYCVCIGKTEAVVVTPLSLSMAVPTIKVLAGDVQSCAAEAPDSYRTSVRDSLHFLSAGLTSFARGLNDTPKIAALLLAVQTLPGNSISISYGIVAAGIIAGGLVAGRNVTHTLSRRITSMDPVEGFVSNAVTSALVSSGSLVGLPFSTTHVATSGIVGVGVASRGTVQWKVVREILLAWIVTLPSAAACAFVVQKILEYSNII